MSNQATAIFPWLLLVQQLLLRVAAQGSSPGGIEVSKDSPPPAEQDSWLFPEEDEGPDAEDLTLVDTLLTTDDTIDYPYWYRRVLGVSLSARQAACARNGTVRLRDAQGGGCAWLLEQGPCAPSHWLVLQSLEALEPVCRPRPCAPGYGLQEGGQRCAPEAQLCSGQAGRAFRYSLRGEGRCHCKGFRALGPDGQCHVLYEQGACPEGEVLVPAFRRSLGSCVATCERATCAAGEVRTQAAANSSTAPAADPQCEELNMLDCASSLVPLLADDIDLQVPVCAIAQRTLFATPRLAPRRRPRPDGCLYDAAGRCLQVVILAPEPFAWRAVSGGDSALSTITPTTPTTTTATSAATATASPFLSEFLSFVFPK